MIDIIDFINNILFWIFLYVLLWQGYILFFNKGIPNITTAPAIRKAIIEKLKTHPKATPVIYDLGCGNGKFSREMARALPHAQIIGIEICNIAFLQAVIMKKITSLKNITYIKDDFYNIDLSNADIVFFFLLGRDMGFIREKIEKDVKSGTWVITNKFQIGGHWKALETCSIKTLAPAQKSFYVYEAHTPQTKKEH